jgi:methyl-accepting chemotaxis protein
MRESNEFASTKGGPKSGNSKASASETGGLRLNIRIKLVVILLISGLIPLGALTYSLNQKIKTELLAINKNKLISLREEKKLQIESYFRQIDNQIVTFSNDFMIIDAMKEFKKAFSLVEEEIGSKYALLPSDGLIERYQYQLKNTPGAPADSVERWLPSKKVSQILQSLYITENSNPIGQKHFLKQAEDSSSYSKVHGKFHPVIRDFLERFGYYDIFLVEPKTGRIVYSVFKEVDFSTSLLSGPYANTGIGKAFKSALKTDSANAVYFEDFHPYEPSYNAASAFIASSIYDNETKVGVLILQAPVDRINEVMSSRKTWEKVGLGKSGEVYLVGPDYKMRNNSRLLIEQPQTYFDALEELDLDPTIIKKSKELNTSIGFHSVETQGSKAAIKGLSGFDIFSDYRGIPVLSAYEPVSILGVNWAIIAEVNEEEALETQNQFKRWILIFIGVLAIILIISAYFISGWFSRPIVVLVRRAQEIAQNIARGDLKQNLNSKTLSDLGVLQTAFSEMQIRLQKFIEYSERVLGGDTEVEVIELEGEFKHSLDKMLNQAKEKKEAEQTTQEMSLNEKASTKDLRRKVDSMLVVIDAAAKGNLTHNVTVTGTDSIGRMGESLSTFFNELISSIRTISNTSTKLTHSVQEIDKEIKEQATVSAEQASSISEIFATAEKLVESSAKMAERANSVTEISGNTLNESKSGMNAMASLKSKIDEITKDNHSILREIMALGKKSNEIGKVMNLINSIADQTKLIAFNAAIEAAGAGEAGKRFAVVAGEIRHLADNVMESTSEIQSKTEEIQKAINKLVMASENGSAQIIEGGQLAEETIIKLEALVQNAKSTSEAAETISYSTIQQKKDTDHVLSALKEINKGSKQTSSAISRTSSETKKIFTMSEELKTQVGNFTIEKKS